ncbi:MAG: metal-dependent hydrolase [Lactobacillaceae bacterium]|jgi:L-ascorbate metabolism protein UlaG (beta-lactamase superfamily)|nr:metal-dependent hydrolase [Lactobacillaceae bacterium]
MKFNYYGQSTFVITTENGTKLLFDPFFTSNPLTKTDPNSIEADYILVSHAHNDHAEDLPLIAKNTNAQIIGMVELTDFYMLQGLNVHAMNIGGQFEFPFGTVKLTHAQHSSSMFINGLPVYMGEPVGFLLDIDGKRIYYSGDTSNFGDMELFGKEKPIDLAILPIGDNFTMGPHAASSAAKRLNTKSVIPVHYNTYPLIEQDPYAFAKMLPDGVVTVVEPDTEVEI